jgi:periplasmic mercuric ion binding protein
MKKLFLIAIIAIMGFGAAAQSTTKETIVIQTNGVCKTCEDLFSKNVPYFKGVTDYSYDAATSKMTVTYNPKKTTPDEIRKGIGKLGYDADNVKADTAVRAKLPACCRVDKPTKTESKSGCSNQKNGSHCGSH